MQYTISAKRTDIMDKLAKLKQKTGRTYTHIVEVALDEYFKKIDKKEK